MPNNYNISPTPLAGNGAYGKVPGNIGIPPNLYQGIQSVYPGINRLTSGSGNVIQHEVNGELSPETIQTIQNEAASFGVNNGMPQSQFSGYRGLRNLGLNVEQVQRQGVQDFQNQLGSLSHVVNDPNLSANIADRNATLNAAPNPQDAVQAQLAAYQRAMAQAAAAGRSPAGGTPGMGGPPPAPLQSPGVVVGNSTATGTQGGITPGGLQNWQQWANGLNNDWLDQFNSQFDQGTNPAPPSDSLSPMEGDF